MSLLELVACSSGLVAAIGLISYLFSGRRQEKGGDLAPLVPGGLPLLGHVTALDAQRPHLTLYTWARQHGDIFRFKVLSENVVVVNSKELIREALFTKGAYFAGRPYIFRIHYGFHYAGDIIFGDFTPKWLEMKKFATSALKSYAVGVANVEDIVNQEMLDLKHVLLDVCQEGALDPRVILMTSVVNAITASVIGKRFNHDDEEMIYYKRTTRLFSEACSPVNGMELDLFPWLRFFPNQTFKKLTTARGMIHGFVERQLEELKGRGVPGRPTCIIEALLDRVDNDEQAENKELAILPSDVKPIFIDLLVSSTFTTSVSLSTFVMLMMEYPDVKERLAGEIRREIGYSRLPTGKDRAALPYMEATILEILRYISHVPLNLPHYTTADTTLGGFFIPAKTQVLLNLWHLHHDDRIWEQPWEFKPSRFLDEKGQLLAPTHELRKSMLMFSGGRRACLGENLARERLFLFCTLILQQFDISAPPGSPPPSTDPREFDLGLILEPKPFTTVLSPRAVDITVTEA